MNYSFIHERFYAEAELMYLNARYYDPTLGLFLQPDWFEVTKQSVGTNRYAYSANDPVNAMDPSGNDAVLIVYPQYRASGIPFTGHAGVLLIDDLSGSTRYYEYGRYDSENLGFVMRRPVNDLEMADNGLPTEASLRRVMATLSRVSGKGGPVQGDYFPDSDNFDHMVKFAEEKMADNSNPNRTPYNICYNNCFSFAESVINEGRSEFSQFTNLFNFGHLMPDHPISKSVQDVTFTQSDKALGGWFGWFILERRENSDE